ncbi:homocysteine biosynthesis protein [Dehalobacterium formicoaceticum]|uniref:Homocysteine biosynthesis protein n=1 Tax=Dehalobacterium formicoaceticum TaxID=51515 RepID=A0ABT1Y051_9FIRM|nr:homocysteine biosynthesis protein [Dehalobacterium formicoaceticum]MCR6544236.1 homocysteine biosynthesis protein [Dehalobacterium formicoaceticum]
MSVTKTYEEINEKIKKGKAVVVTAEEIIDLAKEEGISSAAAKVDVVTTGTFGAMCSSGAFLNFGHSKPKMKMQKVWLNGVSAYGGIAAVDAYIGATELPDDDPCNKVHPGNFNYGGGHVLEDLVSGKPVKLEATAYGTDCYPRKKLETTITIHDLNYALLFNPRNAYQNYNVGINTTDKTIYTYMGVLRPHMMNANYSCAGQLSPLMNDPYYRTIGIGTRIFLGGGIGYIAWHGTQHSPSEERTDKGIPTGGAGTLALMGDLKQMSPEWLRGLSILGYGASLAVGVGIPIPILNEEILEYTLVTDEDIFAPVVDYGTNYPNAEPGNLGLVSYAQLKSGKIEIQGKEVKTAPMSSYPKAKKIAETLKDWINNGKFLLTQPVEKLPSVEDDIKINPLIIK